MDGETTFEVAYSDILCDGVPLECKDVIDLKDFAPYAEFRKSVQRCGLEFAWDDDLHYVRHPRWNPVVFANVQKQDLALDCARRLRNEADLEMIKNGRVRVEVLEIGSERRGLGRSSRQTLTSRTSGWTSPTTSWPTDTCPQGR